MEGFTRLGKIVKAHGILGELKAKPLTNCPSLYLSLAYIFLEDNTHPIQEFPVQKIRFIKKYWLIQLENIQTRNEAEEYCGKNLWVQDEQIIPLQGNEFFVHDIMGAEVYDTRGIHLGKIVHYFETGANGVCETETPYGLVLFPTTKEVLKEIIPESRKIVIDPLPGMFNIVE